MSSSRSTTTSAEVVASKRDPLGCTSRLRPVSDSRRRRRSGTRPPDRPTRDRASYPVRTVTESSIAAKLTGATTGKCAHAEAQPADSRGGTKLGALVPREDLQTARVQRHGEAGHTRCSDGRSEGAELWHGSLRCTPRQQVPPKAVSRINGRILSSVRDKLWEWTIADRSRF
jgi:hypothetical protein